MRIPPAYQTQAMNRSFLGDQEPGNMQVDQVMETSVSMRLGKLGITYSVQDAPPAPSSPSETFSRPTTSFAQELSLALARDSQTTPFLPSLNSPSSPTSHALAKVRALQAYDQQQTGMQQPMYAANFSAVA